MNVSWIQYDYNDYKKFQQNSQYATMYNNLQCFSLLLSETYTCKKEQDFE